MKNRTSSKVTAPTRGLSAGTSKTIPRRSDGEPTTPVGDPEAILRESRKKARAAALGLTEDKRQTDTAVAQSLNTFSFNALDSIIAEETVASIPISPSTPAQPTSHLLPQTTITADRITTHEQAIPTTGPDLETLDRIPSPFLRPTGVTLPGDPPRLTFATAPSAFPSMHPPHQPVSNVALTSGPKTAAIDRLARLEALVESLTSTIANQQQASVQPVIQPAANDETSRRMDRIENIIASMAAVQERGIEALPAQAARGARAPESVEMARLTESIERLAIHSPPPVATPPR